MSAPRLPGRPDEALEAAPVASRLEQWRTYLAGRDGVTADDVDELEDHLAAQMDDLTGRGLSPDEAFLIAVKRLGSQSVLAADFARENSSALWKQLVLDGSAAEGRAPDRAGLVPMLVSAVLAGGVARLTWQALEAGGWMPVPVGMLALFGVGVGYFSYLRRPSSPVGIAVASVLAILLTGVTVAYPFAGGQEAFPTSQTEVLAWMHLPIAFLVLLGIAYLGDEWRVTRRWMDYVRFVGEWIIYLALIGLGAMVLLGIAGGTFSLVGVQAMDVLITWVLPLGFGGALVVAAWLVEAKKSVVENMAPVLTVVFTPLFVLLLVALLVTFLATGDLAEADRDLLILIDLLLVVVWGLVLFATSARADDSRPRAFDWLQLALLVSALLVDLLVLVAMGGRIGEFGASPNKVAALGENLVIAVNLVGALWLQVGFLRRRVSLEAQRLWQCRYLPVVGLWAAVVVLALPPLFRFI